VPGTEGTIEETRAFSARLRLATRGEHRSAESGAFMRRLFAGELPEASFAALTTQLYFVYAELERVAAQMRDDPDAAPFLDGGLARVPALEADLAHFHGDRWRQEIAPGPTARAYADRVAATAGWPGGLVAHHYTRYLGDLSGGQDMARAAAEAYGLTGPGLRFYAFPEITDPVAFKRGYRGRLDALAAGDEAERDRIIAEARVAYGLNIALLDEVGAA
jgi:heme oxygenase